MRRPFRGKFATMLLRPFRGNLPRICYDNFFAYYNEMETKFLFHLFPFGPIFLGFGFDSEHFKKEARTEREFILH